MFIEILELVQNLSREQTREHDATVNKLGKNNNNFNSETLRARDLVK
jgi:hypothetical protein